MIACGFNHDSLQKWCGRRGSNPHGPCALEKAVHPVPNRARLPVSPHPRKVARPFRIALVGAGAAPPPNRRSGQSAKGVPCETPSLWFESEGASVAGSPSGSLNPNSKPGTGWSVNHQPLPGMLRNSTALERRAARVATSFFPPTGMPRRRTSDKSSLSLTEPRALPRENAPPLGFAP